MSAFNAFEKIQIGIDVWFFILIVIALKGIMKTTNAEERVKRDRIMDKFCQSRNLWYDSVNEFEQVDAKLYNEREAASY